MSKSNYHLLGYNIQLELSNGLIEYNLEHKKDRSYLIHFQADYK